MQGFEGDAELEAALKGCDVVIIPAGVPRKPGMTRDDLFKVGVVDDQQSLVSRSNSSSTVASTDDSMVAARNQDILAQSIKHAVVVDAPHAMQPHRSWYDCGRNRHGPILSSLLKTLLSCKRLPMQCQAEIGLTVFPLCLCADQRRHCEGPG